MGTNTKITTPDVLKMLLAGKTIGEIVEEVQVKNITHHIRKIRGMLSIPEYISSQALPYWLRDNFEKLPVYKTETEPAREYLTPVLPEESPAAAPTKSQTKRTAAQIAAAEELGMPDWEREARGAQKPATIEPVDELTEPTGHDAFQTFETWDIGLAAALYVSNHDIIRLAKINSGTQTKGKVQFVFRYEFRLKQDRGEYFDKQLSGNYLDFYRAVGKLRHWAYLVPENKIMTLAELQNIDGDAYSRRSIE